jgi:lysophospholipase
MAELLFSTANNPVPENHIAGYFESFDKRKLRYAIFKSATDIARGTVVLLHGRNESIEKYYETIRDLNARGLWVATFDWRGQGGSDRLLRDRRKGHVRRLSDYQHDLDRFLQHIVLPDTRLPFFILAHSMGGLIALASASRFSRRVERMVVVAPFVSLPRMRLPTPLLKLVLRLVCMAGFGGLQLSSDTSANPFETNVLTSDPQRFRRNRAIVTEHPDLGLGPPTARWLLEMFKAMTRVRRPEHLASIMIPTLVIGATADQIVPLTDIEQICAYFRAGQLVAIDGARHEILQEQDRYREQAMAALSAFVPGSDVEETDFGSRSQ